METVLSPIDSKLSLYAKKFIKGPRLYEPTFVELQQALVSSSLSSSIVPSSSREDILDSLGISIIIDLFQPLGPGRVAVTPAGDAIEAQRLLRLIEQESYHQFRQALGIPYHWILQFNLNSLPEIDALMSLSMFWYYDYDENPPECSILELC